MTCEPTTVAALRTAINTRVHGLAPDHAPTTDARWRRLKQRSEVKGTTRGYYLSISDQHQFVEGIFTSGAVTYAATLRIWTGYANLNDEAFEDARSADERQLWVALTDQTITGLWNVLEVVPAWEDGDDSDIDKRWGAHVFTLIYLLDQP